MSEQAAAPQAANPQAHRLPHVGALDGLHAVALIAVLCYHEGFRWARGGFLGVSTFFTLSGFLITTLLLVERKTSDRLDLRRFWSARARRLLPAALVTLVLVVAFAHFAATPPQLTGLRGDLLSCFALATNWRLAVGSRGYSAYLAGSSPVQHFWSLAVEEQFYLVLPVLLLLVARRSKRPHDRLAAAAAILAVASSVALWTAVGPSGDTSWAYYATYTRAAELLAGVLLACMAPRMATWRHRIGVTQVLGVVAGIGLVVAWALTEQTARGLYRGGLTVYTLASTAVVFACLQPGPIRWLLSLAPLRWIGRLSYSAYLYHWPLYLWLTSDRVGVGGYALFGVRVAATLALSAASTAFLERPIRVRKLLPRIGRAPIAGVLAAALSLTLVVPSAAANTGPSGVVVTAHQRVQPAPGGPAPSTVGSDRPKPTLRRMLLVGDSIMHQASPYFAASFPKVDVQCACIDGIGPLTDQSKIVGIVHQDIEQFDPDVVVFEFAGSYLTRLHGPAYVTPDGTKITDGSDLMFSTWDLVDRVLVADARSKGAMAIWALTPAVDPKGFFAYLSAGVDRLNDLYRALPDVSIVDWHRATLSAQGTYATVLTDPAGHTGEARSVDGLHFTAFGYRLLVQVAAPTIATYPGRSRPAP